jgi:hypothetical protein
MAAAVVISRRKPICVILENAIRLVSRSHQRRAIAEWTCSAVAKASQTLTSGKLNEVIDLFVGEVNAPSCERNQRRIETQPPPATRGFGLFDGALNAC